MSDTIEVSSLALWVLAKLHHAGYEAYVVGGAVRDLLYPETNRYQTPFTKKMDYDFTTDAKPDEILSLFSDSFYENSFGTVSLTAQHILESTQIPLNQYHLFLPEPVPIRENRLIDLNRATKIHESLQSDQATAELAKQEIKIIPNFEITTFRSDGVYSDHRRPDTVTWGTSLREDLDRRDFTLNAMALSINSQFLQAFELSADHPTQKLSTEHYQLHDPHHGLAHLQNHMIASVGDADTRFQEDALRMLRAVRFSVQLNCSIQDTTVVAIKNNAPLLAKVSQERIADELLKMLASQYPAEGIELLDRTGLLAFVLPELLDAKEVKQGGHHTTDVWTHSIDALRECPSPDPIVRLATLLHDIGKPATYQEQKGTITFYNHEVVGSRIASSITRRLTLSKKNRERVFTLVRYHMFHYRVDDTDAAIRRFMRKVGLHNLDDMLDLRESDRLGSGARRTSWRLEEMKERMSEQLHQPMQIKDLALNGHDLMQELGLKPGKQLGKVLQLLFEQVLEKPELNQRETLLTKAKSLVN